jgi:hypothetical protein
MGGAGLAGAAICIFCQVRGSLGRRRSAPYRRCRTRGADSRGNGDRRRCCACGRCRANRRRRSRWNFGWNHDHRRRAVGGRHRCGSNDSRSRRRGRAAGASIAGLDGRAFGSDGDGVGDAVAAASGLASTCSRPERARDGRLRRGRAAGCSAPPFCCVMARSTSPGREICERSILVLISSSP